MTSPFSFFAAEMLLNLPTSLLTVVPDPEVNNSLCFFFSSPPPFPFSLSFSRCLSLLSFLDLEEEGALWRKKSLCLKTL